MMMKKSSPNHHRKSSRAKKKKGKGKMVEPETAQKPRAKGRQWTKVEEEALAMAFTKASNCPIVGNNQTGSSFWKKTTDRFNAIMEHGEARDVESVSGKWRKMIKVVNAFNQIYNQIYLSPPSGSNEQDILNLAIAKWDSQNSTPFPHFRAWNVVRKEQKWKPVPNEVATPNALKLPSPEDEREVYRRMKEEVKKNGRRRF
ncbi:putative glutathione transferase transcription factor MYB family [Helianthus annuus]|nr:putative glutathione transferase transcription factor MYB family [Helianthus annuus]